MNNLVPIKVARKTGEEVFVGCDEDRKCTLKDFWKWSVSDLVSNATRGILAEFIVACAFGLDQDVRHEWDAYDLQTERGVKIEVSVANVIL